MVTGLINTLTLDRDKLSNISRYIDQTLLKFDKTLKDYQKFVEESDDFGFRALVVPSTVVRHVVPIAKTRVAGVVGFPYGYYPLKAKLVEIEEVAEAGGKEVDVVVNLVSLKSGDFNYVAKEVKSLVDRARELGLAIKVIVETSILTDEELRTITEVVVNSGADFIKTNTGFGARGASLRDVILMKQYSGSKIRIKAAGGIRNAVDAVAFLMVGADVIGSSSGIQIVKDAEKILKSL